jgi:hypothetical protein
MKSLVAGVAHTRLGGQHEIAVRHPFNEMTNFEPAKLQLQRAKWFAQVSGESLAVERTVPAEHFKDSP